MASQHPLFPLLFSLFLPFFLTCSFAAAAAAAADADLVAELSSLRSQSPGGIIHLNDNLLRRIFSHKRRSFSFAIFFDAAQLHSKSELQLPTLRSEFSIVSSSFLENRKSDSSDGNGDLSKLFFFDIEFQESQHSFSLFGVNALPHVRLVNPNVVVLKNSDQLDQGSFNSLAESLAEFIESKTRVSIGLIHRPPMFSRKQLSFFAVILMALAPFAFKKIITGETLLHDYKLWLFGAIFIYFFSVSGSMHNIIRKMPMFIADRHDPSKLIFFYQGSGMQLGAEGIAVGFLYTVVGLLLAMVTHGLVKVRNLMVQRFVMVFALIVSFWAVRKVIYLDNWKTGYGVHGYWPSSW